MQDDMPENARSVRRHQATEPSGLTVDKLREKARELRVKTRREIFANIALAVIVIGFSAHGILHTHQTGWQLLLALTAAWALAGLYRYQEEIWPRRSPVDWAPITGFDFYRLELRRRHDLFRRFFGWSFGPAVLAVLSWLLVISALAKHLHRVVNFLPFSILAVLWAIGVLV